MMELTKERLNQIVRAIDSEAYDEAEIMGRFNSDDIMTMARQLLSGLEQEPVAQVYQPANIGICAPLGPSVMMLKPLNPGTKLYAAPQLPQPAPECKAITQHFDTIALDTAKMVMCDVNRRNEFLGGDIQLLSRIQCRIDEACRAAFLQGAEPVHDVDNTNRQFESLGCAEDTARRFKCTGLIVTSDERKMEPPCCSKHQGTELRVHPFEQLMSYPPQPVMYCPLCKPEVAEWVERDKQIRNYWKDKK